MSKLFGLDKDGGPESRVWGFWLIGLKKLFSVVLLRFEDGSREAYHTHAFNAVSWVLRGELHEEHLMGLTFYHLPSWRPVYTTRDTFHRVSSVGRTWVISLRGPWADLWLEWLPETQETVLLTHNRVELARGSVRSLHMMAESERVRHGR